MEIKMDIIKTAFFTLEMSNSNFEMEVKNLSKLDIAWYLANGYITADDYRKTHLT